MKIIHLSDTHIGRDDNERRMQALLQDIATLGATPDTVLVHTGDLINQGHPAEMQTGRALLDGMAAQGWRILLAPGNHDYGDSLHVNPQWAAEFRGQFARYLFGSAKAEFPVLTLLGDCAFIGLDSNAAEMGFW
jgi:3',5'-cyclic AMP phosphodiesterase CpdA